MGALSLSQHSAAADSLASAALLAELRAVKAYWTAAFMTNNRKTTRDRRSTAGMGGGELPEFLELVDVWKVAEDFQADAAGPAVRAGGVAVDGAGSSRDGEGAGVCPVESGQDPWDSLLIAPPESREALKKRFAPTLDGVRTVENGNTTVESFVERDRKTWEQTVLHGGLYQVGNCPAAWGLLSRVSVKMFVSRVSVLHHGGLYHNAMCKTHPCFRDIPQFFLTNSPQAESGKTLRQQAGELRQSILGTGAFDIVDTVAEYTSGISVVEGNKMLPEVARLPYPTDREDLGRDAGAPGPSMWGFFPKKKVQLFRKSFKRTQRGPHFCPPRQSRRTTEHHEH